MFYFTHTGEFEHVMARFAQLYRRPPSSQPPALFSHLSSSRGQLPRLSVVPSLLSFTRATDAEAWAALLLDMEEEMRERAAGPVLQGLQEHPRR
jgi:hypothetical protein